jgi:hypothetical protein
MGKIDRHEAEMGEMPTRRREREAMKGKEVRVVKLTSMPEPLVTP